MMPALVPGILLAVTAIGPAFGFLGGAFLLRFYVDLDKIAAGLHFFFFSDAPSTLHRVCVFVPDEVDLDRGDLRWVGAWWLGFLVASCLLFVAALPYFFFPRGMAPEVRRTLPARRGAARRLLSRHEFLRAVMLPLSAQEESGADEKRQPDIFQEVGLLHFLKSQRPASCPTSRRRRSCLIVCARGRRVSL